MPSYNKPWWHRLFRLFRYHFTTRVFGEKAPINWHLKRIAASHFARLSQSQYLASILRPRKLQNTWNRSHTVHFFLWMQGKQRQHFGPTSRIPELFQRRDQVYLGLDAQQLQWYTPPPPYYHDLLDAAAKVGALEERIGYTFTNKMTCIEALKVTGNYSPFYFKGVIYKVNRNNRLALLGDRILGLAMCEIWFQTGHSTGDYAKMTLAMETRAALNTRGRALNLHKSVILANASAGATPNHIAEAFEAILGAIYIDSGYSVRTIKDIIRRVGLDDHEFLKARDGPSKAAKVQQNLEPSRLPEEQERKRPPNAALESLQHMIDEPISGAQSQPQVLEMDIGRVVADGSDDIRLPPMKATANIMSKKSRMQMQLEQTDTNATREPEPNIDESVTERSVADTIKDKIQEEKHVPSPTSNEQQTTQTPVSAIPPVFDFNFEKPLGYDDDQTQQTPLVEREIFESEMERYMANVAKDDQEPLKSIVPAVGSKTRQQTEYENRNEVMQSRTAIDTSRADTSSSLESAPKKLSSAQATRARKKRRAARLEAERLEVERAAGG